MSDAQRASQVNLLLLCAIIMQSLMRSANIAFRCCVRLKRITKLGLATRNQGRVGELTEHLVAETSTVACFP